MSIEFPIFNQDDLWVNLYERFYDVAATVGDCLAVALRDFPGTSGAPKRACYPNFGGLAWDDCDCGGTLQVSLGRRTSTLNFPNELADTGASRPTVCAAGNPMQDYTIEYSRCWPGPGPQGRPPSCESMRDVTRKMNADIFAMRKGLYECLCSIKRNNYIVDYIVRASQPGGPEGNCVAWVTTFSVEVASLG